MRSDALSRADAGSFPKLVTARRSQSTPSTQPITGMPAARDRDRRGRGSARFDTITQEWLRDPVKEWSRFRLATGCSFSTISAGALGISRFSGFLAERHPDVDDEADITRAVLEDYLSWLATGPYSTNTRLLTLSMLASSSTPAAATTGSAICPTPPSSTKRSSPTATTGFPASCRSL